MKTLVAGLVLATIVGLAGCSGVDVEPVHDYGNLPGSGERWAKGPGVMVTGKQRAAYDGGYTVYSSNPNTPAAINPNRGGSYSASASQQQSYENFERFKHLPKNSTEYQEFKKWQEYQQYKAWKAQQQAAPQAQ